MSYSTTVAPLVSRDIGVTEALRDILPPLVREAFAVLTHLGDAPVLFALLFLYYLSGDRHRGATALNILLGGFALFIGLKHGLGLARPPSDLHVPIETGFGFPSGHAFDAVVGFGLLAVLLDVGTRRARYALAGAGVVIIGFSRLAIGVHYAVDVLAGIGLGLVYLLLALRLTHWDPTRGLVIAIVLSIGALGLGAWRGIVVLLVALAVTIGHRRVHGKRTDAYAD